MGRTGGGEGWVWKTERGVGREKRGWKMAGAEKLDTRFTIPDMIMSTIFLQSDSLQSFPWEWMGSW